jgi:hypothetical protein
MSTILLSFDVGIRNLAVCKVVIEPNEELQILHWDVMDVLETVEAEKKMSIPDTAKHMVDTLLRNEEALLHNPQPTAILIEQQPGGKFVNVGMKALSHVLQTFMYMKASHIPIHFVSARKKLQKAESHEKGTAPKKRYTSNKQFAKETALELLNTRVLNKEEALTIFNKRAKKDDLADALLQAVSFSAPPPAKKRRTKK